jgi:hypothetical protein
MSKALKKVGKSLNAYTEWTKAIHAFFEEIQVRGGEIWICDTCFGSAAKPGIVPLYYGSPTLVAAAIERAESLVANVTGSISKAIEAGRSVVERLKAMWRTQTWNH